MFSIPQMPTWDASHPIIVHLPLGALPVAAVLVVLALLLKAHSRGLLLAALATMAIGTVGILLAAASGEAAAESIVKNDAVERLVEEHEEIGEAARNFFIGLTAVFALFTGVYWLRGERTSRGLVMGAGVVFLAAYGAGLLVLVNAGHAGGVLVHQHGVHASLGASSTTSAPPALTHERDDD